jgi:uncharacterized HAD superfamily protein/hypoxanthine phosphoribosyltransferase
MIGYVSVAQLASVIRDNLHRVPRDVELVVGIPRSGMIPAHLLALYMNRLVVDLETFLAKGAAGHGRTRAPGSEVPDPLAARHVLLVDDSMSSGRSMQEALERVRAARFPGKVTTLAVIVTPSMTSGVDLYFKELPRPRVFEWNLFHHPEMENSCFDLDGVLCVDPTDHDNDDGPRYLQFLSAARPRFVPTRKIAHIVSARLEKYRAQTEDWLGRHGIAYGKLHLIDLPSAAERQRLGVHATHKAAVYQASVAVLFYESDVQQAKDIARLSGKPVLCTADMQLYLPGLFGVSTTMGHAWWRLKHPLGRLKGRLLHSSALGRGNGVSRR